MNAELFLFGRHVNMAPRARRRWLVILVYTGFAGLLAGLWSLNHWHRAYIWVLVATTFANRLCLGGELPGGLIKPFRGKGKFSYKSESSLTDLLRWGFRRAPDTRENYFRNDEREMRLRDHAHFKAARWLSIAFMILFFAIAIRVEKLYLLLGIPIPSDSVLYGIGMVTWILLDTLPQAILLWTEPDMEAEG